MGLIKATLGSLNSLLADQWREYFYCDSMGANVLVTKGQKRVSGRSSNTKGSDNIITNGSIIAVNEGQCMMIVDQGEIMEFSADAGEFVWDTSTEPTIFYGGLGKGLKGSWDTFKRRFTFGGDTGKDQRVYFFNLKELVGNRFGTPSPVPFRVVDANIGLDMDIAIRCNGEYSYKIADPILFYKNVCGNVSADYTREQLDSQLKSEFMTALQPAFAKISAQGIRYSALPGHTLELAEAMKNAASNPNGAMMGFMGMGMAQQAGGMNAAELFRMGAAPTAAAPAPAGGWKCACGKENTGKFCTECGAAKPAEGWECPLCGKRNQGKFCSDCGTKRPAGAPVYRCDKCGWEPEDPKHPPKFCPECGDKFDENDAK